MAPLPLKNCDFLFHRALVVSGRETTAEACVFKLRSLARDDTRAAVLKEYDSSREEDDGVKEHGLC